MFAERNKTPVLMCPPPTDPTPFRMPRARQRPRAAPSQPSSSPSSSPAPAIPTALRRRHAALGDHHQSASSSTTAEGEGEDPHLLSDWRRYYDHSVDIDTAPHPHRQTSTCCRVYLSGHNPLQHRHPEEEEAGDATSQQQDSDGTTDTTTTTTSSSSKGDSLVFVLLHGAGLSSMAWALCASELRSMGHLVCAIDFRAHGSSTCSGSESGSGDLSAARLVEDTRQVLLRLYGQQQQQDPCHYRLALVGHSLGGAIAARTAFSFQSNTDQQQRLADDRESKKRRRKVDISALCVVDVVEGTALSSLKNMRAILDRRPQSFRSLQDAVKWSVESGQCRDMTRAWISMPSQLVEAEGGRYTWRAHLHSTEKHWSGWFEGLSEVFLAFHGAKLILLANTDRLDTPLTIAQMQGKFVMQVLRSVGHFLIEDDPCSTAGALMRFVNYFGLS